MSLPSGAKSAECTSPKNVDGAGPSFAMPEIPPLALAVHGHAPRPPAALLDAKEDLKRNAADKLNKVRVRVRAV
jgi:hypothetical protein